LDLKESMVSSCALCASHSVRSEFLLSALRSRLREASSSPQSMPG
jgi:hypothetical protein